VQLQECESAGIPLAVVIGGNEIERGVVKLRDVELREEVCYVCWSKITPLQKL